MEFRERGKLLYHHREALKFGAMALAIHILEGVYNRGEDAAFPWSNVL